MCVGGGTKTSSGPLSLLRSVCNAALVPGRSEETKDVRTNDDGDLNHSRSCWMRPSEFRLDCSMSMEQCEGDSIYKINHFDE